MNISPSGFVAVLLVLLSAGFSGCTGTDPAVQPAAAIATTVTPATVATAPPPSHVSLPATTNQPAVTVFGPYHWAEYRNNITQTLPPNPRYQWEIIVKTEPADSVFGGTPALHEKITETLDYPEWVGEKLIHNRNGWIIATDRYYDAATGGVLGGTRAESVKGGAKPSEDLPASPDYRKEDKPSFEMGIAPFGEMNITLRYGGKESVTVPAGTYPDAGKYTGSFRDGTPITFWIAPDIPVPVQYRFPNKYLDGEDPVQTYELNGWG